MWITWIVFPRFFDGGLKEPIVSGNRDISLVKLMVNLFYDILGHADSHGHPPWSVTALG